MTLYLVERLAANVFAATYRLSINRLRSARAALILAYTSYYATMCILLALIAFAMMVAFSAILMICFPELYHRLVGMQWIPPIHHLFFMFGIITSKETTCFNKLSRVFEGLPAGPIDPMPWIDLLTLSLLLPLLLPG
jgi:hypothetical protein